MLLNIRACSTSDSELERMNADYMMHGFLCVPNAWDSRAYDFLHSGPLKNGQALSQYWMPTLRYRPIVDFCTGLAMAIVWRVNSWFKSWLSVLGQSIFNEQRFLEYKRPYILRIHWGKILGIVPVIPDRGSWRPPPRSHVGAHTIKRAVSVCPHFLVSISRSRLLSQDRKLCFCRLRVKVARSRRQI